MVLLIDHRDFQVRARQSRGCIQAAEPAPTITTRYVVLPFIASLYKIQRDDNRLQKF